MLDVFDASAQSFNHGLQRLRGFIRGLNHPAQTVERLRGGSAKGKPLDANLDVLPKKRFGVDFCGFVSDFNAVEKAAQFFEHRVPAILNHGTKQGIFAGEILVERAHGKTSLGSDFVGGEVGHALAIDQLGSGLKNRFDGELGSFLNRLLSHVEVTLPVQRSAIILYEKILKRVFKVL